MADTQDNQQTGAAGHSESGPQNTQESVRLEIPPNTETKQKKASNVFARSILQRHMRLDPILLIYIVILLIGGIYAYVKKDSCKSLVAAVVSTILLTIGAYFEGFRKNSYPLIIILAVLAIVPTYRYFVSSSSISLFYAILTILMLIRHSYIIYSQKQRV